MQPTLQCSDEEIKNKFKSLIDFEDVALLLEIPAEFLWKILIRDKLNNYTSFPVSKKSGGYRTIYSPSSNLGILQKKLAYVLSLQFNPHNRAHGFIEKRSIVTNASEHLKKSFVLNIDLENFFESISFARVRKMFASYFKLSGVVATTLANICSHPEGFLPQGAATSPIISNIIAKSLDKELKQFSVENKGVKYTRYADDITFSTNKKVFPRGIAFLNEESNVVLSEKLLRIIENNGFKVNEQKIRLQDRQSNQSVTGIVVNEKLNVSRTYIRRIRSILNCIEKNIKDLDVAREVFNRKYPFRQRAKVNQSEMFSVLRGMINHVGHVKGTSDPVYLKLANRFNNVSPEQKAIKSVEKQINKRKMYEDYTYVIEQENPVVAVVSKESNEFEYVYHNQGTGFLLKGIGMVTNAHVLKDLVSTIELEMLIPKTYYVRCFNTKDFKVHMMRIECFDTEKDIAILRSQSLDHNKEGFSYSEAIQTDQLIDLIGYPDYRRGQEIRIDNGFVRGIRMHTDSSDKTVTHRRYEITPTIYGGNSGGPIVNEASEVIAVAVKGATMNGVVPNEVIPVSEVIGLAKRKSLI